MKKRVGVAAGLIAVFACSSLGCAGAQSSSVEDEPETGSATFGARADGALTRGTATSWENVMKSARFVEVGVGDQETLCNVPEDEEGKPQRTIRLSDLLARFFVSRTVEDLGDPENPDDDLHTVETGKTMKLYYTRQGDLVRYRLSMELTTDVAYGSSAPTSIDGGWRIEFDAGADEGNVVLATSTCFTASNR